MSSIATVVDRLYRDYLTPPDEQPAQAPLAADINSSTTTLTLTAGHLAQAELDALAAGVILECEQELLRILTYTAGSPITLTVAVRGSVLGTSAAAHSAGAMVRIAPKPARRTVFDAVGDAIVALWPTLGQVKAVEYSTGTGSFIEVAADVEEVLDFRYSAYEAGYTTQKYPECAVELLPYPFPPATTTGRAIQLRGAPSSRTGYLRYLARFTRPTTEADTFTSLALNEEWMPLLMYASLLRIMGPADLSSRQVQFITRALEVQGFPVGSGKTLAQTLVQMYEYLLGEAREAFRAQFPMKQTWMVL